MLKLTEVVYLAAPFARPEEQTFNARLAELVRAYNFPLFMPQEALAELKASDEIPAEAIEEEFTAICMDRLTRSNLVIAVFYGEEFDPLTAFEVGYALGRRTNVVAIQNHLEPELCRPGNGARLPLPESCSRIVITPEEDERFPDRLIPFLNRYFEPHKPLSL